MKSLAFFRLKNLFILWMIGYFLPVAAQQEATQKYVLTSRDYWYMIYSYSGGPAWIFEHIDYYYNAYGQDTLQDYQYAPNPGAYTYEMRYHYRYDSLTGKKTEYFKDDRENHSEPFKPVAKNLYFYNAFDKLDSILYHRWDTLSNQWQKTDKKQYTYIYDTLYSLVEYFKLVNHTWQPHERYVYEYDSLLRYHIITKDTFDDSLRHAYVHVQRNVYQYYDREEGTDTIVLAQETYIDSTGSWQAQKAFLYIYDPSIDRIIWIKYMERPEGATQLQFTKASQFEYEYPDLLIAKKFWEWDGIHWTYTAKNVKYFHTPSVDETQTVLPHNYYDFWHKYYTNYKLDSLYYNIYDTVIYYKLIYNYERRSVLSQSSPSVPQIVIYPNPVKNVLHILTGRLEPFVFTVYDANGKVILTRSATTTVNLSHLKPGIYFYRLETMDNHIKTGTLIKE